MKRDIQEICPSTPTAARCKRNMSINADCSRCINNVEDLMHMVRDCATSSGGMASSIPTPSMFKIHLFLSESGWNGTYGARTRNQMLRDARINRP